ncbi:MAG TPA: hypothetical protein DCZ94_05875 [Lentisphaeria bacterium]|nr:MAG: hypothetical protein A2X48_07385 [Lentisphaerae bacterium GWF2_49_21]HBC86464.1 hypothetical protein [Lentisphaeria bacterium]
MTVKDASENIVRDSNWKLWLFQFMDDFRRNPKPEMVVTGPVSDTPEGLKCLFAATVYYLCNEKAVDVPEWVFSTKPLREPWFVSGLESMKTFAIVESPLFFKKLNVFVTDNFMVRV